MAAIVRLFWRSLTHDGFVFLASCSRTGKTTVDVKNELATEVERTIITYERWALVWLGVAALIHLPYIILLTLLPNPTTNPVAVTNFNSTIIVSTNVSSITPNLY